MEVKAKFKYPVWQNEKNYCIFKYILEMKRSLPSKVLICLKVPGSIINSRANGTILRNMIILSLLEVMSL